MGFSRGPGIPGPLENPFTSSFNLDWLRDAEIMAGSNLRVFIVHGREDTMLKYELDIKSRDTLE